MQQAAHIIAVLCLVAGSGLSASETERIEQSAAVVGMFLADCARPMVAGLPAEREDMTQLSAISAQLKHGQSVGTVYTSRDDKVVLVDSQSECSVGAQATDPQMVRSALNTIFNYGETGFRRARFERDSQGGFRLEFFRRDQDRTITVRARVRGYAVQGRDQAQISVRETPVNRSFGR